MQTGSFRSWTAIVLALAIVCHGIVAIYTVLGARSSSCSSTSTACGASCYGLAIGAAVVLLSACWIGPFVGNHQYMTDMKYGARPEGANDSFWDMFFPLTAPLDFLVTTLAVIGFVACVVRRHANGTALGVIGLLTVALVYWTQDSLPVIGLLWNPRLLPLLYLVRYLLMMVGVVEVVGWARQRVARPPRPRVAGVDRRLGRRSAASASPCWSCSASCSRSCPGDGRRVVHDPAKPVYAWGPFRKTATGADAQGDGWSRYNFTGYEGRPPYPEYYDVVQTMADIGRDQRLRPGHVGEQRGQRRSTARRWR